MDRRTALTRAITALLTVGLSAPRASSQQGSLADGLVGTWSLVSIYDEDERGEDMDPFGENPQGQLVFDATGRFSFQIFGSAPKFASNDRKLGTSLENSITLQDSLAYFGTYSVDGVKSVLTLHVERCLFRNWNGGDRIAWLRLEGARLDLTSAVEPSFSGSYYPHSVWNRMR